MKKIIPVKLIIKLNINGTMKSSLLQYKISVDGKVDEKFYTMTVDGGVILLDVNKLIKEAIQHSEKSEDITDSIFKEVEI